MTSLELQALDEADLKVVSAHVQDAIQRIADFSYNPAAQRFSLICNRFDWAAVSASPGPNAFQRRLAVLSFARVTRARFLGFEHAAGDGVLSLLAIGFEPGDPPAGAIRLQFAAGAEVRLDVECIEVELKDTDAVWTTATMPNHTAAEGD